MRFSMPPHPLTNFEIFHPFSMKTSKSSGSCNNINDPYGKLCVPDVTKNMNIKVFNLMSRTNVFYGVKRRRILM